MAEGTGIQGVVADYGPCPYLPGRRFHAFLPAALPAGVDYRALLDHRFRRNGAELYTPVCPDCTACRPLRVVVADFAPRADQRRCARRNTDLVVSLTGRGHDAERTALWRRYETVVHGRTLDPAEDASAFAESGVVDGGELHARDAAGRLLAVSVVDVFPDAVSSVYCYYEPSARHRALGTFMALVELAWARERGCTWWYPGFHVAGCTKMAYKARFGPHQILADGTWINAAWSQPG